MRSGRIELPLPAWQAGVLPLNDDRLTQEGDDVHYSGGNDEKEADLFVP